MGTSGIPLLAAFFIGLMTAVSPCPLATNITAIAYISKHTDNNRHTLLVGTLYCLGRMISYTAIAALIVYSGMNVQSIALFLQTYGERILGPVLIVMGVVMLDIIKVNIRFRHSFIHQVKQYIPQKGYLGGFLLGILFAFSFCPFSAVLFFGMLIPIALKTGDGVFVPIVYAIATALPVIIISQLIVRSVTGMGTILQKANVLDYWLKKGVALVFIFAGMYLILLNFGA
jgi:cytochrome c-type biogenesis protein